MTRGKSVATYPKGTIQGIGCKLQSFVRRKGVGELAMDIWCTCPLAREFFYYWVNRAVVDHCS